MTTIVLIAALVGALFSAMLSFVVRRVLDARAQRESERKLAYVVLVRISGLLAIEQVIRDSYLSVMSSAADLASPKYDASHRLSAIVAFLLSRNAGELTKDPKYAGIPRMVRRMLEDAKESRLSPEQLSKLPRTTIYAFHRYQNEHSNMCQVAGMWSDYFENGERSWVTPEGLHDQWRSVACFLVEAAQLRNALVNFGAATNSEAEALIRDQRGKLQAALSLNFTDKQKLEAAGEDLPAPPGSHET